MQMPKGEEPEPGEWEHMAFDDLESELSCGGREACSGSFGFGPASGADVEASGEGLGLAGAYR